MLPYASIATLLLLLACGASDVDGAWEYWGPECPDVYENCNPSPTKFERMNLVPLGDWTANPLSRPWIGITCWEGSPLLMFFSSGEQISESGGTSLTVALHGEDPVGSYSSTSAEGRGASFGPPDVDEILDLMSIAESEDRELGMVAVGKERVEYRFDVTGFDRNLARLPCGAAFEETFVVPTPVPPSGPYGNWKYHGPECPQRYANCDLTNVSPFLSLYASKYVTNKPDYVTPRIQVTCKWTRPHVAFDAGGALKSGRGLAEGAGYVEIRLQPEGGERATIQATATDEGLVDFVPQSAREILALLDEAESQGKSVRLSVDPPNRTAADFTVAGLRDAIMTLPCA